jgi:hypothetical protein
MNIISIGKDPRSIIYKHLIDNDLYILRYVNTIFMKEINKHIKYLINYDTLDYKILCWIEKMYLNNDYIKHRVVKYFINMNNFEQFKIRLHYINPKVARGKNIVKYMIRRPLTYDKYIEEFAKYNFSWLNIPNYQNELLGFAYNYNPNNRKIYKILNDAWINRCKTYEKRTYIVVFSLYFIVLLYYLCTIEYKKILYTN